MIVVDTNVMVRLVVGGADGTDAALLFERETEWAAPSILMSELRNVLVGFVRRGAVTSEQAKAMSDDAAVVLGDRIASVSGHQVIDVACGVRPNCLRCRVRRACSGPRRSFGYSGQCGPARRCRCGGVVEDARELVGPPPGCDRVTQRYEITYIHHAYCSAKMYRTSVTMSACPDLGGGMGKIDMRGIGKDLRGPLHYFRFSELLIIIF